MTTPQLIAYFGTPVVVAVFGWVIVGLHALLPRPLSDTPPEQAVAQRGMPSPSPPITPQVPKSAAG